MPNIRTPNAINPIIHATIWSLDIFPFGIDIEREESLLILRFMQRNGI